MYPFWACLFEVKIAKFEQMVQNKSLLFWGLIDADLVNSWFLNPIFHQAYLPCLVLYVLRLSLLILVRALLATGWIGLVFWLNFSFAVNNRLTFCSVIDIAIDLFTSEGELQRCLCLQSRPHFWTRMRVSVSHSQAADRPICDPGRIFAAWHRKVLTVPWSH